MCAALAATIAAAGCGGADASGSGTVVAAFYPLAYAAEQVGAGIQVSNLTPPGAEPHDLELTPRDVGRVRAAALVVYVGDGFQPSVETAVEGREGPSLDVLRGSDLLPAASQGGAPDPHVWLDPIRYAAVARRIARALGDPGAADALVRRLHALDARFRHGLERCARRELVTSHAAFGYLAARYGLEQVPLVGLSPEAEPGPKELERLVGEVRGDGRDDGLLGDARLHRARRHRRP